MCFVFASMTTSQEVIMVLLSKYHIMDNPRKFALYEKIAQPGKTGDEKLWNSVAELMLTTYCIQKTVSVTHYCLLVVAVIADFR